MSVSFILSNINGGFRHEQGAIIGEFQRIDFPKEKLKIEFNMEPSTSTSLTGHNYFHVDCLSCFPLHNLGKDLNLHQWERTGLNLS